MPLTPILHSVSYSGSWGQDFLTPEQFVDHAADLGFEGVMLMAKRPHVSVLDYNPKRRAELRSRIEARGLSVVIAGYSNFTADLEHGDIPNVEIQIQNVIELCRLAQDLGGRLVRIFSGYESTARPYSAQWNLIVAALRECASRAAEFGVILGLQNHHDIGAAVDTHFDLINAVGEPNLRAMFDAWAPALQGADIVAAARKMAPLTVQTTVANYQVRPRFKYNPAVVNYEPQTPLVQAVPMTEGFIDYKSFLSTLREGGFRGPVAYEMCSPLLGGGSLRTLDDYATRFLEFISGI